MNPLEKVRAHLRKRFPDQVPDTGEELAFGFIPWGVSTQSLVLDLCIGRPGIPAGRVTQILGLDGEGKSSLAMHIMAETLRLGGYVGLQDTEGAYESYRLFQLGVTKAQMQNIQPLEGESLEEVYEMGFGFVKEMGRQHLDVPVLLLLDSLDGVHAEAAMEAAPDESLPMIDARINGVNFPKLAFRAAKYKVAVVAISQLTTVVQQGFSGGNKWNQGPEMTTKGGKSIKYRASLRLHVKKGAVDQDKSGMINKVEIIKNKLAPPFQTAEYRLDFGHGIDKYVDLWEGGKMMGMITGGGGGRWTIHFRKDSVRIYQKEWEEVVESKGGIDKLRIMMLKRAIRKNLIRPYGVQEIPCAESSAEREPDAIEPAADTD
jgi:recombination protein RecA